MSKKASFRLTATKMRLLLSSVLVIIILGMAAGFYFAYSLLQDKADTVAETQAKARSSDQVLANLRETEKQLEKYSESAKKAERIVAESKSYLYQNQIINDLTHFANVASIPISSFSFAESGGSGSGATAAPEATTQTPPPAQADPTAGQAESAEQTPGAAAGTGPTPNLKSVQVTVQLGDKINYDNLLHFLHLIEQNITRMQISNLMMTRDPETGGVSTQSITLEVYVK